MKRNCNLELRLVTPSAISHSDDNINNGKYHSMLDMEGGSSNEKQLTIFYNGKVAVCDVTELQARAIILLASREMEEKSSSSTPRSDPPSPLMLNSASSVNYSSPIISAGLSMKRSLQRFLQKRKTRVQATSPYTSIPRNHNQR